MQDFQEMEQSDQMTIPELNTQFLFRKRPLSLPADLRPTWRMAIVVLLLKNCCQDATSSLARLHVLSWATRTPEGRESLLAAIDRRLTPDALVVRFEPFLNLAIDYAIGEKLVSRGRGDRLTLTDRGRDFAEEIEANESLLMTEREFMSRIKKRVSQALVNRMFN